MRTLLAAILALTLAPAAQAATLELVAPVADNVGLAGYSSIALADGQVLWIEQRGRRAVLMAATPDGVRKEVTTLPPRPGPLRYHTVTAAGTTALVQRLVCARDDCEKTTMELIRVDLATGAVARFDGCLGDAACGRCGDEVFKLDLRGTLLRVSGSCSRTDGVVDLATGEQHRLPERVASAAGRFAARVVENDLSQTLLLVDWRTGTVLRGRILPLDPFPRDVAVDPDGVLAWTDVERVFVLPFGAAAPRELPKAPEDVDEIELAGGRVAIRVGDGDTNVFRVSALDGSNQHEIDGGGGRFGWAFDGTRLAWGAWRCAVAVVRMWDGTEDAQAIHPCTKARPAPGPVVRAGRILDVRLRCPKTAPEGCSGSLSATVGGVKAPAVVYRVPAGRTRAVTLRLKGETRARSARLHVDGATVRRPVRKG